MYNTLMGIGLSLIGPKVFSKIQDQKVHVVHALPGRVRLQCNRWKNEKTAQNLESVFRRISLVSKAEASPITGSLLLQFHIQTLTQEQFDQIVQQAVQTSVATYPEIESDLMVILKNVINTIDITMRKQSGGKVDVDALLSVVLIINGILRLPANPAFSSSLLYWAYTIITKKGSGTSAI